MTIVCRLTSVLLAAALLAACGNDAPPPRTVTEFVENPILLEAAMVRCSRDRVETRYDQECINAREAVNRLQAKEEEIRRVELEARSEAKRRALRRTLEAQAEARRRAEESQRLRQEAEYLAQFGVLPPTEGNSEEDALAKGNVPLAVVPEATDEQLSSATDGEPLPKTDGANAPVMRTEPAEDKPGDLEAIREELRRRNEDDDGN